MSVSSFVKLVTVLTGLQRCLLTSRMTLHWIWAGLGNQWRMMPICGACPRKTGSSYLGLHECTLGISEPPCKKVWIFWDCHVRRKPKLSLWRGFWERDPEKETVVGGGGERREDGRKEKMSKHIGIPSYLQPYQPWQPQARPESEESILAIQAIAPADDSTPHHHLTASTRWILTWECRAKPN